MEPGQVPLKEGVGIELHAGDGIRVDCSPAKKRLSAIAASRDLNN
jgi:hypothetical protein